MPPGNPIHDDLQARLEKAEQRLIDWEKNRPWIDIARDEGMERLRRQLVDEADKKFERLFGYNIHEGDPGHDGGDPEGATWGRNITAGTPPSANGRFKRTAAKVASKGRWGDSTLAHLTPGEVVLPQEVAQKLQGQISSIMGKNNMRKITVGDRQSMTNPYTGLEEFGFFSKAWRKIKKKAKKVVKRGKKVVKKAVKPAQKLMKKTVPREFRELFPKEVRRINALEKKVKGAIPNELKDLYKKVNSFEDFKRTFIPKELRRMDELERTVKKAIPKEFKEVYRKMEKQVKDIIPNELKDVYKKINSLDDLKKLPKRMQEKFKEVQKKMNSLDDFQRTFIPREFQKVQSKIESSIKKIIPNELKDVYKKINSLDDLKKLPKRMQEKFKEVQKKMNSLDDFQRTFIPREITQMGEKLTGKLTDVYKKINSLEDFKRTFIPKELRRMDELEKVVKGVIPNEIKDLYKKVNSLDDLKKLPGRVEDSFAKLKDKITEDIIPGEFEDVWKKVNSLDDIKDQLGSKLQKVIDIIPGLGGVGMLASRRDVRKAEEAAAAARKEQMTDWEKQMADMTSAWQESSSKLKSDLEGMMFAQEERMNIQTAESAKQMMKSRVAGIRARRDLSQGRLGESLALSKVGGEAGMLGSMGATGPRITGRKARGTRVTAAAIPNIWGRPA